MDQIYIPKKRAGLPIGDYVLIMKENYVLKDDLLNHKSHNHLGSHGGISKEELFVPLIVFRC